MPTAIKIENLSKKYVIGHQRQERYTVLRDVLMHKFRGFGQRIRHPLSPNREVIEQEELWALQDINLEIAQGERVGIIGRNGAGKSTLLKVLSRITEPTRGRFTLDGRVASLLEVGTGFHAELTGRENIFLNGAILGMGKKEIKRKFDEIVDFAETEKFLDTPVKRYSSGMYVRLAFAVAAHLEPEILIVDEVLAVGDAQFQKKCLGKMKSVGAEGRTVLFVSHNMGAISRLCSRAICINHGEVHDDGAPADVVDRYLKFGSVKENENIRTEAFANGNRLCGVQIRNERDEIASSFGYANNIFVFIEYSLSGKKDRYAIAVRVSDMLGNDIFTSWDKDWFQGKPENGMVRCKLPKRLLKPGNYELKVMLHELANNSPRMLSHVAKQFSISNLEYTFNETRSGLIAPVLEWSTVEVNDFPAGNTR